MYIGLNKHLTWYYNQSINVFYTVFYCDLIENIFKVIFPT